MENVFRSFEAVHPLSESLKDYLLSTVKVREVEKKGFLLKAGHVNRAIHFVDNGLLRCFYLKEDTEVCTWFMKSGDMILSIESFYLQKESYENIQALENSTLFYLDYNELQYAYRTFPEFNFIGRVYTEKYHILWAQQLFGLRMQTPVERYRWLLTHHSELVLQVPSKYLASYLGIGEVTLSRIKNSQRFIITR